MTINDADKLRAVVREHYGKAATEAGTGCCGGSGGACCGDPGPTSAEGSYIQLSKNERPEHLHRGGLKSASRQEQSRDA